MLRPGVEMVYMLNGKMEIFNYEKFKDKYSIEPEYWCEVLGLMGDSSDNIPGVRNIGFKKAIKLIKEYKTIENIYSNIDNVIYDN